MANVDLVMRLLAEDRASDKFKKVAGETDRAAKRLDKFKKVAAGVSAAAITAFGVSSVKAYAEAEKQQAKLEGAYKRFPQVADVPIGALRELNSELQTTTVYDDDLVAGSQAVLAQFKLTGAQIKQITPLLLDYASATGKDVTTAATDVGKAMMGQGRALKAVGIDFKATGDATTDFANLTEAMRKQVGGFAENEGKTTAGQLAILQNQFGDLQETVGAALVPALSSLVGIVTPMVQGFNKLPEPVKATAVAGGALAAATLILLPRLVLLKTTLADVGMNAGHAKRGLMSAGKVAGVVAGIAAVTAAFRNAGDTMYGTGENADELAGKLTRLADGSLRDLDLGYKSAAGSTGSFNDALSMMVDNHWWDQIGDGFAGMFGQDTTFDYAREAVDRVDQALAELVRGGNLTGAQAAFEKLKQQFIDAGGTAADFDAQMNDYKNAVDAAKNPTDDLTGALGDQEDQIDDLTAAWNKFKGVLDRQEAADNQERSIKALSKSLEDNGKSFRGNSEEALDNRDALREAMDAVKGHVDALSAGPAKAKAYRDGVAELRATLKRQGLSPKEINALLKPLLDMQDEIDEVKRKASAGVTLKIKPQITGSGMVIIGTGGGRQILDVDYRANGGPVKAGRPYIVGERRAELFVPESNGTIIPRVPAMAGAGGGVAEVNVYLDGRLMQRAFVDLKNQQGGRLNF